MNAAARVIMNLSLRDHVKPALKQLHSMADGSANNYLQAVSVHAPNPQRTSTTILVRLGIHSFCSQSQIPAEVVWFSGLAYVSYVLPRTRTSFGERGFYRATACNATHGIAVAILSVRLSVIFRSGVGHFRRTFDREWGIAHQPQLVSKTRMIAVSCDIKISAVHHLVLSQYTKLSKLNDGLWVFLYHTKRQSL